jgi:SAM-dependent methyltransferase
MSGLHEWNSPVPRPHDSRRASNWKAFSRNYDSLVFSVTSFAAQRKRILSHAIRGVIADIGCGPLGYLLHDIARLPSTSALGTDFCWDMVSGSRRRTLRSAVRYILTDNRCLALANSSIDTIVSVNSILPETRDEVDIMFREVARVLREGGRFVAVLPSFEMSLVAQDRWGMEQRLDVKNRREWDTLGWQCFYTSDDIGALMKQHRFRHFSIEQMTFSTADEIEHIRHVYGERLHHVPYQRLARDPLFEHFLIAER